MATLTGGNRVVAQPVQPITPAAPAPVTPPPAATPPAGLAAGWTVDGITKPGQAPVQSYSPAASASSPLGLTLPNGQSGYLAPIGTPGATNFNGQPANQVEHNTRTGNYTTVGSNTYYPTAAAARAAAGIAPGAGAAQPPAAAAPAQPAGPGYYDPNGGGLQTGAPVLGTDPNTGGAAITPLANPNPGTPGSGSGTGYAGTPSTGGNPGTTPASKGSLAGSVSPFSTSGGALNAAPSGTAPASKGTAPAAKGTGVRQANF